jgi:hypothetical protein
MLVTLDYSIKSEVTMNPASNASLDVCVFNGTKAEADSIYAKMAVDLPDSHKFVLLRYLNLSVPPALEAKSHGMTDVTFQKIKRALLLRMPPTS